MVCRPEAESAKPRHTGGSLMLGTKVCPSESLLVACSSWQLGLGEREHLLQVTSCPSDSTCPLFLDISTLESSQKKKKKSSPQSPDTAMDLLKAITSPLAAGAKSSKKAGEKSSSSSSHSESRKEHHQTKSNGSSGEHSLDDSKAHKPPKWSHSVNRDTDSS